MNNIDFEQLQKDLKFLGKYLPTDDTEAWESLDRIQMTLECLLFCPEGAANDIRRNSDID